MACVLIRSKTVIPYLTVRYSTVYYQGSVRLCFLTSMGYEASVLAGARLLQHFFKHNQDFFDSFEAFLHTRYSGISSDKIYMAVSPVHSGFYTQYLKNKQVHKRHW